MNVVTKPFTHLVLTNMDFIIKKLRNNISRNKFHIGMSILPSPNTFLMNVMQYMKVSLIIKQGVAYKTENTPKHAVVVVYNQFFYKVFL